MGFQLKRRIQAILHVESFSHLADMLHRAARMIQFPRHVLAASALLLDILLSKETFSLD